MPLLTGPSPATTTLQVPSLMRALAFLLLMAPCTACGGQAASGRDAGALDAQAGDDGGDAAEAYIQCGSMLCGSGTGCRVTNTAGAPTVQGCFSLDGCTTCDCLTMRAPDFHCSCSQAGFITFTCNWP